MENITVKKAEFWITTDKSKLDLEFIHDFLANDAYWCKNIPYERVKRSVENSLSFGVFHNDKQIGYAKIISDYSTIAYLGDVFIIESYRGQGLGKWLMKVIMGHPDLQGLRRWILGTRDAHELYAQFGWTPISKPERMMEFYNADVYKV